MVGVQRWLHFYGAQEGLHALILFWLCVYAKQPFPMTNWPRALFVVVAYISIASALFFSVMGVLVIKRLFRPSFKVDTSSPKHTKPTFREFEHVARDGTNLKCRIANESASKVMLVACPLGQCGPSIFNPIMCWLGPEYTYVTWDYRGFFGSDKPKRLRRISIPEHANDAIEVLNACGYKKADIMIGHSMGTCVALETVLLYPDAIGSIILVNGFHGHCFQTAFQLVIRFPFIGDFNAALVAFLLRKPERIDAAQKLMMPFMEKTLNAYTRMFGSKMMKKIEGDNYFGDFMKSYIGSICSSQSNLESWLQLFQEIDAHSVYHLLHTITHPMLLISGYLDFTTPPMQSTEMSRQVPHAVHYCDPFSSHCSILESPEWIIAEVDVFVREHMQSTKVKET